MTAIETIGFIGTGAMGEHMCRHIATKSGKRVLAFDLHPAPLERLGAHGVVAARSAEALAAEADVVLLSLPGGPEVEALAEAVLLPAARPGWIVCDTSTTPVRTTRALAPRFEASGATLLDCPVARTQKAAVDGTLASMVGGPAEALARVRDILACMGPDVSHCGPSGCGQIAKILNNMVLFQTGLAVAEALTIARRAGMDGALLLEVLSAGSADSFALRNHGMGSMVPGDFPEGRFPTRYAAKDLSYALMLAEDAGVDAKAAMLAGERLRAAIDRGDGERYWPVAIEAMAPGDE